MSTAFLVSLERALVRLRGTKGAGNWCWQRGTTTLPGNGVSDERFAEGIGGDLPGGVPGDDATAKTLMVGLCSEALVAAPLSMS
jgi:hypothetical protein